MRLDPPCQRLSSNGPGGIAPRNASVVRHGTLTETVWDSLAGQSAGLIRANARKCQ